MPVQQAKVHTNQDPEAKVWMETLPVVLYGRNDIRVKTYAMLDSGSTTSLMSKSLFLSLGVPHVPIEYPIRTINADEPQGEQYEGVVVVSNLDKSEQVKVKVTTVDDLPLNNNGAMQQVTQWKHLKNIKTDVIPTNLVGILIGSDCAELPYWRKSAVVAVNRLPARRFWDGRSLDLLQDRTWTTGSQYLEHQSKNTRT